MLYVITGRQIYDVGSYRAHDLDAALQHMLAQERAVNRLPLLFRRHTGAIKPCAKQFSQLVLGGDDHNPRASPGKCPRYCNGAQERRIIHHNRLPRRRVEKEIAANAVARRRHACHDRQVVWVGERRHCRINHPNVTRTHQGAKIRRGAAGIRFPDIIEGRAIQTHDDQGPLRPAVFPIVHSKRRRQSSKSQGTPPIQSVTQAWPHLRYLPQAFCAVSCLAPGRTPRGAIGAARSLASNMVRSRGIWLERNPRHSREECLWVRTQSQGQSLGEYCTSHRRTVLYKRLAGRHRASARSRLCCSRWHRQSESYSRLL